ncbi:NAD(P)/FAD-dependent oxidoreductase [Chengkuizengella axinellae]|uniref:NAD(P)/FAD-dependent oxidoreductase n=1 Tax=Chengkuizengella axinellae TaxID=3064388 RepID=A0ABT9J4Z7_9BACL|nr:NAD(P)/FAD-dependent oxidoreductase [Chengkuizengella sp. 2205SS18-9]MDP5276648.1 NAD(P)/FAD-dependent oxidoreductase [Chengkuizengella sp. 2205SS18-9]
MSVQTFEVIVIGGGAAGLSASLILGRSRRKVFIIDANEPRNKVTRESHGFLSRDGIQPLEFKKICIEQLKKYPNIQYKRDRVEYVEKDGSIFRVHTLEGDVYISKKIIFATGMHDALPSIKGLKDVYGKSVYPCPYCDGWERKDEPLAVFGNGDWLMDYVKMIYHWSPDLMVFTNGPTKLSNEQKHELLEHDVRLVETPIEELQSSDGELEKVVVSTGIEYKRSGGFLMDTGEIQASSIPSRLGIEMNEMGGYITNNIGETNIKGVYVIGDAKNAFSGLIKAASEGYELGAKMNAEMIFETW